MKYIETQKYKKKRKHIKKVLKSQIIFDKKIAIRLSNTRYYIAMGQEILNLDKKEGEKAKMSRPKSSRVTHIFEKSKKLLNHKRNGAFYILNGIYEKNKTHVLTKQGPPTHSKILHLVASIPMLLLAYNRIRRNKGALTLASPLAFHRIRWLNPNQRRFMSSTSNSPDGLSYEMFAVASKLLKRGEYPWGASRRIRETGCFT
jgi:hypothetical protein